MNDSDKDQVDLTQPNHCNDGGEEGSSLRKHLGWNNCCMEGIRRNPSKARMQAKVMPYEVANWTPKLKNVGETTRSPMVAIGRRFDGSQTSVERERARLYI